MKLIYLKKLLKIANENLNTMGVRGELYASASRLRGRGAQIYWLVSLRINLA